MNNNSSLFPCLSLLLSGTGIKKTDTAGGDYGWLDQSQQETDRQSGEGQKVLKVFDHVVKDVVLF